MKLNKIFQNKIAAKLAVYFAVCLLVFSVVITGVFSVLFKDHTVSIHKNDLEQRASLIAETLSEFETSTALTDKSCGMGNGMGGGYGAYLRFLDDIAGADVWIIDESYTLLTCEHNHESLTYKNLPPDADRVIKEVFTGKTAFSESFSELLNQPTVTVGTPIRREENVVAVVLLHSPVEGTNAATKQGILLLLIGLLCALGVGCVLSLWLSKSFTDPIISKEATEALRLETLRRDFVANISHELKTPVAVLRGSLEALVDEVVKEPAQVKSYHQEMLNETLFLQRLVGDLLDLSRLQNADFVIETQDILLKELLEDAVRCASHIGIEKNVEIILEVENEMQFINGDYGRLRQMLLIILDNAVKFSYVGEKVLVNLSRECITIRDYGPGISEDELPFLFDRFYKSRGEDNKTGTGLGLAIAKQIAQRHQLLLIAENAPRKGAMFTVCLANRNRQ